MSLKKEFEIRSLKEAHKRLLLLLTVAFLADLVANITGGLPVEAGAWLYWAGGLLASVEEKKEEKMESLLK